MGRQRRKLQSQTPEAQAETERSARHASIPRLLKLGLTPENIAELIGLPITEIKLNIDS
jgi:hypothetical protein